MDARPIPGALVGAERRWLASGRPPQHPIAWRLTSWQRTLPEHAGFFATLPNPIGRADVIELCEAADSSEEAAVRGFLAAMVWGYGRVGYGPHRTALVLSNNTKAHSVLCETAHVAKNEGGPAAFRWMAQHRLRGLGVAFATKYLFFCAANGQGQPALVLDRLVQGWLLANADWQLRLDWRVRDYSDYVGTIEAWAQQLGVEPADVEFLIFAEAASADPTGQWNQTATSPDNPGEAHTPGAAVLSALDQAEDAFLELTNVDLPSSLAFAEGLERLRGLVPTDDRGLT